MNYDQVEHKAQEILHRKGKQSLEEIVELLYGYFEHYHWVGIYMVAGEELVLGPWRGKEATEHIRIPIGTGICGAAASTGNVEVVDDVNEDNRYLACFVSTKSEIVVPIKKEGKVVAEIDVDSNTPHAFTQRDVSFLQRLAVLLSDIL